jgi:hypothetical protein
MFRKYLLYKYQSIFTKVTLPGAILHNSAEQNIDSLAEQTIGTQTDYESEGRLRPAVSSISRSTALSGPFNAVTRPERVPKHKGNCTQFRNTPSFWFQAFRGGSVLIRILLLVFAPCGSGLCCQRFGGTSFYHLQVGKPSIETWAFNLLRGKVEDLDASGMMNKFRRNSEVQMDVRPIAVVTRSKAWNVFTRSNTGIVDSNPTRGMGVCPRFFCVCVVLCR